MVDVRTVGAGGGSIARVDAGGTLRVGPRSAGSEPGPIAYGRGGLEPTITDANLVLGRLSVEALGGDATTLERVRSIVAETLAAPLGISVEEAALAVVTLGNIHMAGAIRMVSLSRGCDPRDLTLFAFGGAGPLHAVALARDLSIPQVLIPARPGLVNALGCLSADFRQDFVQTLNRPLDQIDMGEVHRILADQRQRGEAINAERAGEIVETRIVHAADMQFRGQTHLIRVTLPTGTPTRQTVQDLFEAAYFARFEVRLPEIRAVIVNLTTSVVGRRRAFPIHALLDAGARRATADAARVGSRRCFGTTGFIEADVYRREALPIGAAVAGPAVVEQADATIWLDPGARAIVDDLGNLRVTTGTAP
jgi:N-methylhydantoinase A